MFDFGKEKSPTETDKYVAVGEDGLATVGASGESKEDVARRAVAENREDGDLSSDLDRAVKVVAEQGPITEDDVRTAAQKAGVTLEEEDYGMVVQLANGELEGGEIDRGQTIVNAIKNRLAAKEGAQIEGFDYTVGPDGLAERQ